MRACVYVYVCACVCTCVRACVHACVCVTVCAPTLRLFRSIPQSSFYFCTCSLLLFLAHISSSISLTSCATSREPKPQGVGGERELRPIPSFPSVDTAFLIVMISYSFMSVLTYSFYFFTYRVNVCHVTVSVKKFTCVSVRLE